MPPDSKGLNQLPLIKALSLPLSAGQMVQQALAFFSGPTEARFFCWQFNTVNGAMWEILGAVDPHHLMWMVNQARCLAASMQNNSPPGSQTPTSLTLSLSVEKIANLQFPPCLLHLPSAYCWWMKETNISPPPPHFGLIIKAWKVNGNDTSQLMFHNDKFSRLKAVPRIYSLWNWVQYELSARISVRKKESCAVGGLVALC